MAEPKDFVYARTKDFEDPEKEILIITEKAFWEFNGTINMEEPQKEVIESLGLDAMLQHFAPCAYHTLGDLKFVCDKLDSLGFQHDQRLEDGLEQDMNRFREKEQKLKEIFDNAKANGTNPLDDLNKYINEEWQQKQPTLENFDPGLFFSPGHFSIFDTNCGDTEYLPEFWDGYHDALNDDDKYAQKDCVIANWVCTNEEFKEYDVDIKVYNADTKSKICRVKMSGKIIESPTGWVTFKVHRITDIEVAV